MRPHRLSNGTDNVSLCAEDNWLGVQMAVVDRPRGVLQLSNQCPVELWVLILRWLFLTVCGGRLRLGRKAARSIAGPFDPVILPYFARCFGRLVAS